ncbi:hypothetical protein EYF80_024043 [Liparis tanakae]|uniref:Uncharacterized protein n=1 Tax=Liparis tanakae TaxID=230148 RepID=A0A4Z2HJJ3_9TELE|nr:hypothetical protein EYF80_024043 [Liparis tanakae]
MSVLTTTPVVLPPTMPKPKPDPSFTSSISSMRLAGRIALSVLNGAPFTGDPSPRDFIKECQRLPLADARLQRNAVYHQDLVPLLETPVPAAKTRGTCVSVAPPTLAAVMIHFCKTGSEEGGVLLMGGYEPLVKREEEEEEEEEGVGVAELLAGVTALMIS